MADPNRTYEIRCPVHGFIPFSDWERDVINHPAFQRLRRIRQLAWTDYTYPGAMHTRFEHSLGVMHIASQLFDAIRRRSSGVLKADLNFSDGDLDRDRQIVRFSATFPPPVASARSSRTPSSTPAGTATQSSPGRRPIGSTRNSRPTRR